MSDATPGIEQIMSDMKAAFKADKAAGIDAVIQYHLTGDDGGEFYAAIKDGKLDLQLGTGPSPRLSLTMARQDYLDMIGGKLPAMAAFSSGKLKIGGDMMFALKLGPLFGMG